MSCLNQNKLANLRRCVYFAKIYFGKIHFGNQSLKVCSLLSFTLNLPLLAVDFFFFRGGQIFFVKLCDDDLLPFFQKKMGNAGGWHVGHRDRECANCNISVDNLERCDHRFENDHSKKFFIFWHKSARTMSYSMSSSFGQGTFTFTLSHFHTLTLSHFYFHTLIFTLLIFTLSRFHNFTLLRSL